jgi:hypothetical protein
MAASPAHGFEDIKSKENERVSKISDGKKYGKRSNMRRRVIFG